jgi:WD40 repeat protein
LTPEREAGESGSTAVARLTWNGEPILGVALVDGGSSVLTAHESDIVRVWNLQSGRVAREGRLPGRTASLSVSADGRRIVVGLVAAARGVSAVILDPATLEPVARLSGQAGVVQSVAVTSDGAMAATAGEAGVWLWDVAGGRAIERWPQAVRARALSLASDGALLAAGVERPAGVMVWPSSASGTARLTPVMTATAAGRATAVVLSPDGRLVSGADDGRLRMWDVGAERARATLEGHSGAITAIAVSPDGNWIVSASQDRTVRVWDDEPSLVHTYQLAEVVEYLAFSDNGERLAAASRGGTIAVWDLQRLSMLLLERRGRM